MTDADQPQDDAQSKMPEIDEISNHKQNRLKFRYADFLNISKSAIHVTDNGLVHINNKHAKETLLNKLKDAYAERIKLVGHNIPTHAELTQIDEQFIEDIDRRFNIYRRIDTGTIVYKSGPVSFEFDRVPSHAEVKLAYRLDSQTQHMTVDTVGKTVRQFFRKVVPDEWATRTPNDMIKAGDVVQVRINQLDDSPVIEEQWTERVSNADLGTWETDRTLRVETGEDGHKLWFVRERLRDDTPLRLRTYQSGVLYNEHGVEDDEDAPKVGEICTFEWRADVTDLLPMPTGDEVFAHANDTLHKSPIDE